MVNIVRIHGCGIYRISLNKRAGPGGTKWPLTLVRSAWNWLCDPLNTLTYVLKIWLRSVHWFLRYGQTKSKVGGAFIQAGTFIQRNTVNGISHELFLTDRLHRTEGWVDTGISGSDHTKDGVAKPVKTDLQWEIDLQWETFLRQLFYLIGSQIFMYLWQETTCFERPLFGGI